MRDDGPNYGGETVSSTVDAFFWLQVSMVRLLSTRLAGWLVVGRGEVGEMGEMG